MDAKQVLIINSKGGVGKSTLSSNLATFFACNGLRTALHDFDRQMSGIRWLERRDRARPRIDALTGWEYRERTGYDWIIMDPPPGMARKDLRSLVVRSDVIIIPVLPSPIDIHSTADFIRDLLIYGKVQVTERPVAVVANRTRTNTHVYDQLKQFLQTLKLPIAGNIRDSQNYIHASTRGIGIFEMDSRIVGHDLERWQPLLGWIDGAIKKARKPVERQRPRPLRRPLRSRPVLHVVN